MGYWPYLVGLALVVAGFLVGRFRGGNAVRARDISGIVVGGDVSGSVSQTTQPSRSAPASSKPDRVAWVIGIVGVLIAAAALIHDVLATK
ncbi:MAG TPA: hypothetical protein VJX94_18730 [Stellaceae bacterium]|nr:hypothetical protein [Stellaceae bacterium]